MSPSVDLLRLQVPPPTARRDFVGEAVYCRQIMLIAVASGVKWRKARAIHETMYAGCTKVALHG